MSKHDKYSASKISRILRCPGSEDFIKHLVTKKFIPEESTSSYADEGTMLHSQQELLLAGKEIDKNLTAEQVECLEANRDFFLELQAKFNWTWYQTEQRVSLKVYVS